MNDTVRMKKLLWVIVLCTMFWGMSLCAEAGGEKYNGGIVLDEDANPIKTENGLMPSKGNVDVLVVLVEFQDIKHDASHTPEYMEALFMGEAQEQDMPQAPISLKEYYQNASYGQLNISCDTVGWYTAEHERSYYSGMDLELPGSDLLFREVVTALDSQIDYSRYDSDNDGYIDGIYLVYAGGSECWGSTFWTYVSTYITEDLVLDNINLRKFCFLNEYENVNTLSHETGHMLGLMDYYDYEKGMFGGSNAFGTNFSLMVGSMGELDALSKVLLGWVIPQKITENTNLSLRPINEYPDAALVYARGEESGRTFFLVESYSATKNFVNCIGESGLRIYRVNATLESDGKSFLYGVKDDNEVNTISIALDTINGHRKMTPYNMPSSYLLEEDSEGKIQWKPTGVTIDGIVIDESKTACSVKYEAISASKKPKCTIKPVTENNRIYLELNFDVEVKLLDEALEVAAVSEENNVPMILLRNDYSSKRLDSYYAYTAAEECKSDTTYTITIPAGSFQCSYGAESEAITYTLCTSDFPEVAIVARDGFTIDMDSQIIPTKDGGLVYFCVKDEYLQKVSVSASGEKVLKALMKLENPAQWNIRACQLNSGDYIVYIYDNGEGALYKVDAADNCKLLKNGLNSGGGAKISAIGENAVLYNCSEAKYFLIKEDGTVNENIAMYPYDTGYMNLYKLGENRYITGRTFADCMYILDSEMNVVSQIEGLRLNNFFEVLVNEQGFEIIGIEAGMSGQVCSFAYDNNFNFLSKTVLPLEPFDYMSKYEGGYVIAKNIDRPFFNEDGQGSFYGTIASPIMRICFYDDNDNLLFSYTADYDGTGSGDSIVNAIQLSDGRFAWATDWQVYITQEVYESQMVERIELNVEELNLEVGDEATLTASIYPTNATNKKVNWKSSNTTIATVDENGKVIATGAGTATITVTAQDGSGISASCEVTITQQLFADVPKSEWFYPYVKKAYDNGYMSGTGTDSEGRIIFKPLVNIPREQFVTVLYALEDVDPDSIQYSGRFSDVKESDWFAKPVEWAAQNGIVSGVADGEFGVGQEITREQMALMLFKYAGYKGYDVTVTADISSFPDVNDVSSWAMEAMRWAIQNGVMSGQQMDDAIYLNPKAKASRAVCATMIVAFAGKYK